MKLTIKIKTSDIKRRDENIAGMITTTGGKARTFKNKKRAAKSDKTGRKAKHKNSF